MNPLLLIPFLALVQGVRRPDPPPGLVLVPGGRTAIGIEVKELERLLEADRNSESYAGALNAETPRHEVFVDGFDLMTTEVTNEQFEVYVRATGVRPPEHWGDPAIRAGADQFFADEERLRAEALAQGRPVPEPAHFDRHAWWHENWRDADWSIPPGDERRPVVFVDYDDASAYARWAGLRLPTELEYQRAVRGDGTRAYPWGNEWDSEKYAATSLQKKKGSALPVASFPAGASRQGIFDLAGNVWEWTASPYAPFPGYEPRVYEFGYGSKTRSVNALSEWNPRQRVVVGGSFQNGNLMARATTRRPADRTQATDALGFRCAASRRPGVDQAAAILGEDLDPNLRPREDGAMVEYAPAETVAWEQWTTAPEEPDQPESLAAPGYAVITSYRYVLWTPVATLRATDLTTLERQSVQEGPVALGFFSTNVPVAEPELAPGTYLVSYRARGTPRIPTNGARNGAPVEEMLELDLEHDHLVFTTLSGRPVIALREHVDYGNLRDGRVVVDEATSTLTLETCTRSRTTLKGFTMSLVVRLDAALR